MSDLVSIAASVVVALDKVDQLADDAKVMEAAVASLLPFAPDAVREPVETALRTLRETQSALKLALQQVHAQATVGGVADANAAADAAEKAKFGEPKP